MVVLVAMAAAVTLALISLNRVNQQSQMRRKGATPQTSLLIESAVSLAKARLAEDPEYSGETWLIATEDDSLDRPGEVVIAVAPHEEPQMRNIEIQVTLGDNVPRISRESLNMTLSLPQSEQKQ
ncbi:hypothetical protein [Blastopirellula marina]|uniref:hypothetical protein n=1 Tax=Blastopirellula marina TaxID=124 RepID=UPI0011B0975F|nr:hypothetical protein [Blastopirellula marina]